LLGNNRKNGISSIILLSFIFLANITYGIVKLELEDRIVVVVYWSDETKWGNLVLSELNCS
jgi:hypothetical protein